MKKFIALYGVAFTAICALTLLKYPSVQPIISALFKFVSFVVVAVLFILVASAFLDGLITRDAAKESERELEKQLLLEEGSEP